MVADGQEERADAVERHAPGDMTPLGRELHGEDRREVGSAAVHVSQAGQHRSPHAGSVALGVIQVHETIRLELGIDRDAHQAQLL